MARNVQVLTAFYDLEFGPVSFDFVTWLVRAMKERDRQGCHHLHVVVVPKEDGLGGFCRHWGKHDAAAAYWRLWHIVIGCCPLAGATMSVAPTRVHAEKMRTGNQWWPEGKAHFMGPLVEAARRKEQIPLLRASDAARRYVNSWLGKDTKVVTLTIRQQDTDADRNSDREAWDAFEDWLLGDGWSVIWIDDANVALAEGEGYAELDPDLRLALYERVDMNVIGNNGPQELLKFSAAPYLIFGLGLTQPWRDHFKRYFSMNAGDQLPWAGPKQRLVYRPDSFEVMREEFSRA